MVTPDRGPSVDRPVIPDGYGVPDDDQGLLTWAEVEDRLRRAKHYWMATVRPDGAPHVVPRWGVWLDGRFWYDGAPTTVHARNLRTNGACTLHLESGTEAVILDGTSRPADPPGPDLGARISAEFGKYAADGYAPEPDAWEGAAAGGLTVFTPYRALAWVSFPGDLTRFTFDT
jgi:hypothetical protein